MLLKKRVKTMYLTPVYRCRSSNHRIKIGKKAHFCETHSSIHVSSFHSYRGMSIMGREIRLKWDSPQRRLSGKATVPTVPGFGGLCCRG